MGVPRVEAAAPAVTQAAAPGQLAPWLWPAVTPACVPCQPLPKAAPPSAFPGGVSRAVWFLQGPGPLREAAVPGTLQTHGLCAAARRRACLQARGARHQHLRGAGRTSGSLHPGRGESTVTSGRPSGARVRRVLTGGLPFQSAPWHVGAAPNVLVLWGKGRTLIPTLARAALAMALSLGAFRSEGSAALGGPASASHRVRCRRCAHFLGAPLRGRVLVCCHQLHPCLPSRLQTLNNFTLRQCGRCWLTCKLDSCFSSLSNYTL